jgi:hypothetical protein
MFGTSRSFNGAVDGAIHETTPQETPRRWVPSLFTQVPRREILRTSPVSDSRKFEWRSLGFFPRNFLVEPHGFVFGLIKAEAERKGQVTGKIGTCRREVVEVFLG